MHGVASCSLYPCITEFITASTQSVHACMCVRNPPWIARLGVIDKPMMWLLTLLSLQTVCVHTVINCSPAFTGQALWSRMKTECMCHRTLQRCGIHLRMCSDAFGREQHHNACTLQIPAMHCKALASSCRVEDDLHDLKVIAIACPQRTGGVRVFQHRIYHVSIQEESGSVFNINAVLVPFDPGCNR